jgi:hypothetical protein
MLAAVLFASLCVGLLLPHQDTDGTFPRTPPGYDISVRGTLGSETNSKIPIIVFLHAMLEDNRADRIEWFDRIVREKR